MSERGLHIVEGEEHVSFKYSQKACQLLIEKGSPNSVFTLYFLTLRWNLISHSGANESISLWENDHLKICIPKQKFDQIGLNKEEARHI